MVNKEYVNINTIHLYYFIEVVECSSFTLAAQHLYTTQSTLSKCISSIESALNVQLFIRSRKKLQVTEAGLHLYNSWKEALGIVERSIAECRALRGGYASSLVVGGLDTHKPDEFIVPAVMEFSRMYPDIHVHVETYPAQEVRKRLINGGFDLVFTVLYDIEQLGTDDFDSMLIKSCPHQVCMLRENPLAQRSIIRVGDLQPYEFISISPQYTPSYNGMLADLCGRYGFSPNITRYTASANSLTYNLKSEKEIFISDQFYRDSDNSAVCCRPIADTQSGVVAAWRRDNRKGELQLFVERLHQALT